MSNVEKEYTINGKVISNMENDPEFKRLVYEGFTALMKVIMIVSIVVILIQAFK